MGMDIYMTKGDESVFITRWDRLYETPTNDNIDELISYFKCEEVNCKQDFLSEVIDLLIKKNYSEDESFSNKFDFFTEMYDDKIKTLAKLNIISSMILDGWKVEVNQ